MKPTLPVSVSLLLFLTACVCHAATCEERFVFETASGERTDACRGSLQVPENRANPESRQITLRYVRFAATGKNPGVPVVYLAGGPGGSGIETARHRRFPLFMAMREFGDVIAFDQRGTGESNDMPRCKSRLIEPDAEVVSDEAYAALYRSSIAECRTFWREKRIDLAGYTTLESVRDLEALRHHLGAARLTLWGTSYGSHLALAALKEMGNRLERIVISSAEGLDQTVKLPARTEAYFDRLQAAIDSRPEAHAAYPDIKDLIARVHRTLEAEPVPLQAPGPDGEPTQILLQRRTMQMLASGMIADPESAARLAGIYASIDRRDYEPLTGVLQRYYRAAEPVSWNAMPLAMDVASGISNERLERVRKQGRTALLGMYLNFPMPQVREALPKLDLGEDFRKAPESTVPTLLLSGTLDGRTYLESQREAVAGLANLQTVTVVNAGHNLFMSSPEVIEAIQAFMRGEALKTTKIVIALPEFVPL